MSRISNQLDGRLPAVTGFGVVSAIGVGAEEFWKGVRQGRCAHRPVTSFDTTGLSNHVACELPPEALERRTPTEWEDLPRATLLGALAAREALEVAGLEPDGVSALFAGTTMANLPEVEDRLGDTAGDPADDVAGNVLASFASTVSDAVGVPGPALTVATSCSAGNVAVSRAVDLVRSGRVSRVLAGGADSFSRLAFIGFSRMRAMARERCTPFSLQRQGMLLGEGSAFLVIESLASARQRGCTPYAVILGYGLSCDAFHVATPAPNGRGAADAMHRSLEDAGLTPDAVDYVCAHGTGTVRNDRAEALACRAVFGDSRPLVSSLKALVGHSLGAASALEAVACILSLRDQEAIPAWNVDEPDAECDVDLVLPDAWDRGRPLDVVLSNALAFGGNNSCIALGRVAA